MAHGRAGATVQWTRGPGVILVLVLFCASASFRPCAAQLPAYTATQFACASFDVRVHTTVTTVLQGTRRVEEVRRDGRLMVKGSAVDSGIAIEAWWDSLTLSRRAEGEALAPDAAGLIGGRYRGLLHPDGRFVRTEAPWIPDAVAEVSDLSVALDDLFPSDSGVTVRRLGDSARVRRYRVRSTRSLDSTSTTDRPFAVLETESSDGVVAWSAGGLLSWDRTVHAETRVQQSPSRSFRSVADQRITLRRVGSCSGG